MSVARIERQLAGTVLKDAAVLSHVLEGTISGFLPEGRKALIRALSSHPPRSPHAILDAFWPLC
jgi:hypothetical protein